MNRQQRRQAEREARKTKVSMVDDRGDAVALACVYENNVPWSFLKSRENLLLWDLGHDQRLIRGGYCETRYGTDGIVGARNETVAAFLDSPTEWLWWVDTDMGFAPDTVDRLFARADPVVRPIVGALAFTWREMEPDGMGGFRCAPLPTVFDWVQVNEKGSAFRTRGDYPPNSLVQCAGTGSACILIHRSVFEKIAQEEGPHWYDRLRNPATGKLIGEDLSFCARAGKYGIPVHVDTSVKTTHAKQIWVDERDYMKVAAPVTRDTDSLVVLVPVLNRPHNVRPLLESLFASGAPGRVLFVASPDDRAELDELEAQTEKTRLHEPSWRWDYTICPAGETWPQKINYGYRHSTEDFMLLAADDVAFHPGWWQATRAARVAGAAVIGTNDLGNKSVLSGDHATHPLVRRAYVDQFGTLDEPGKVVHDGYSHWFVDNELVATAKARGVWLPCLDAIVEHLHPLWGKGEDDDTYRKGEANTDADRALFEKRVKLLVGAA